MAYWRFLSYIFRRHFSFPRLWNIKRHGMVIYGGDQLTNSVVDKVSLLSSWAEVLAQPLHIGLRHVVMMIQQSLTIHPFIQSHSSVYFTWKWQQSTLSWPSIGERQIQRLHGLCGACILFLDANPSLQVGRLRKWRLFVRPMSLSWSLLFSRISWMPFGFATPTVAPALAC